MGSGFNYMSETCWCMQTKNEGECPATSCMGTRPAEECMTCLCNLLSGLMRATSFVNVACMLNCIMLEWSNM